MAENKREQCLLYKVKNEIRYVLKVQKHSEIGVQTVPKLGSFCVGQIVILKDH